MYLHKTTDTPIGKPEPPVRNATSKSPPPQAAKPSASHTAAPQAPAPSAVPRSASALIAAAGLPVDKLSASIISFARFFSLPIKPELMAVMRRQTLAPSSAAAGTAEDTALAKIREALSLAAAAAESKGVELHPKGLEAFAEAIDPDWQKREDSGGGHGRRNKDRRQQEEKNAADKTSPITAAALKQLALEAAEQNPLLAILNRLPGKNGQRWIVLPFSFDEDGREFKVSLRILLETDQAANRAVCVALDIAEAEQRWLFALESTSGLMAADPANRLAIYLQPELPPKVHATFVRQLSDALGIPPARIAVRNFAAPFPFESVRADELLRSINEAV